MWYRSEIPALGDHRALLIGQGRGRACLSRFGETWALTSSRGTVTGELADVLGGWPMPGDADLAWVAG